MSQTSRWLARRWRNGALLALIVLVCAIPVGVLATFWRIPEWQLENALHLYPHYQSRLEARAYDNGRNGLKMLYLWTEDDLSEVREYFETIYPQFQQGDVQTRWLITGFEQVPSAAIPSTSTQPLTFESICHETETYTCTSLSLVDLQAHNPTQLPITRPPVGMRSRDQIETWLEQLSSEGTLIVYTYSIVNMS